MGSVTVSITASADDGHWTNASLDNASTTVRIGSTDSGAGSKDHYTHLRFLSVGIPKGSTILTAKLTVVGQSANAGTLTKISGNDVDSPVTPPDWGTATSMTKTTAQIDWDPSGWTDGVAVDSPSITTIIQELIERLAWASGNNIQILIQNDGGTDKKAIFYSVDHGGYAAPKLVVTYDPPPSGGEAASITPYMII